MSTVGTLAPLLAVEPQDGDGIDIVVKVNYSRTLRTLLQSIEDVMSQNEFLDLQPFLSLIQKEELRIR